MEDFESLIHELFGDESKESKVKQALAHTHCILCDNAFVFTKNHKRSPNTDHGYDGLVCKRCVRTILRDKIRDYKDRSRKTRTFSSLTSKQLFRVIVESSLLCGSCSVLCNNNHSSKQKLTIDHDYPLSLGGMNIKENLVVLCMKCHREKDNYKGPKLFKPYYKAQT